MAKIPSAALLKKFAGSQHYHTCTAGDCRQIYGCNCHAPAVNGRCHEHSEKPWALKERPLGDRVRDPQPCCTDNTRQITYADVLERHRLAGPGPWFICKTCARCHGRPVTSTSLGEARE